MNKRLRTRIFIVFGILAVVSLLQVFRLKFAFDFEQFFPQGDPDLEFFQEFIQDFEADDNFLLIAVENEGGVFDSTFLPKFHDFSLKTKDIPYVLGAQSLTQFSYPVKTPFAITTLPAIHIDDPSRYASDKKRIMEDERFVYNLISPDANTLAIYLKTVNQIQLGAADSLMTELTTLADSYGFDDIHYLGRAYFQQELVYIQQREIIVSAVVSSVLVLFIMFLIFRKPIGIIISLVSVGLGMILFTGFMGIFGREVSTLSALYPVLMIIVGTSDVVHIMSKYIDELRGGATKKEAVNTTVREIGMATLLTSVTTAVGFATLLTSRIGPIKDFGLNAGVGVVIAYLTVVTFTVACLSMYDADQLSKYDTTQGFWKRSMEWFYRITKDYPGRVAVGTAIVLVLCGIGISKIQTDYKIITMLPNGTKIKEDFFFFEKEFTGFRPLEFAVTVKEDGVKVDDYAVAKEIDRIEQKLKEYPSIRAVSSLTAIYKSINRMYGGNKVEAYTFPSSEAKFNRYKQQADKLPPSTVSVLISKDKTKARIASRILDSGAETIKIMGEEIDDWIAANIDSELIEVKRTGTGLIIDKNSEYVRHSLLWGLGLAIFIVSMIMVVPSRVNLSSPEMQA